MSKQIFWVAFIVYLVASVARFSGLSFMQMEWWAIVIPSIALSFLFKEDSVPTKKTARGKK